MPNINDPHRAQLIKNMAKRESIAAAEALLEKAVDYQDKKRIKTATSMLHDILTENFSSAADIHKKLGYATDVNQAWQHGYAGIVIPLDKSKTRDAFYSSKRGENMRPVECKPEDCATCFWRSWCEMKESFDLFREVDRSIQKAKDLMKAYHGKSSVETRGEAEAHHSPSLPQPIETEEMIRKREDWRVIRKHAKDILEKAKRNN